MRQLGGTDPAVLPEVPSGAFATIATRLAEQELDFGRTDNAGALCEVIASAAPETSEALKATRDLAAWHEWDGRANDAALYRSRLETEFGVQSPWARRLRSENPYYNESTESWIARLRKTPPDEGWKRVVTDYELRRQARARMDWLFGTCLPGLQLFRRRRGAVEVDVRWAGTAREGAALTARPILGDDAARRLGQCLEARAPEYFGGFPRVVHARIRIPELELPE